MEKNENGNQPAFPIVPYPELEMDIKRGQPFGLTKREYFAAMAMQGILSCGKPFVSDSVAVAKDAVLYADALLNQLNQSK